jgi:predicted RecA/RadA family phage recombinase
MTTKVVQDGNTYEYTNAGSAISSGDPVAVGTVSAFLGIAANDIAASTGVGTLIVEGVVTLPKVTAAVFAAGDQVLWDSSVSKVDDNAASPATGDFLCGTAWVAGTSSDTTATIKLSGRAATVT